MTRGTTRIALAMLTLGHLLSAIPFTLSFIVLLPFKFLGFLLNLAGFRLVLGSRTDDIPGYMGWALLCPMFYVASLLMLPVVLIMFVLFVATGGSVLWKVLFFVVLGLAGIAYTAARSLFQMPLRTTIAKVLLVVAVVVSLVLTVALPPLSLLGAGYAGVKAHDALADLGPKIWEWAEPYEEPNMTANSTTSGGGGNLTLDDGNITQYLKARLLNPVLEKLRENANETANVTADVADAVITFGIPLAVADLAYSLATLLWAILFTGTIVSLGRRERRWDDDAAPATYYVTQDFGPD